MDGRFDENKKRFPIPLLSCSRFIFPILLLIAIQTLLEKTWRDQEA